MKELNVLLAVALLWLSLPIQAAMVWQPVAKPPSSGHGEHGSSREKGSLFQLVEGEGAQAMLWAPNLSQSALPLEAGKAKITSRGVDNYHALVALREEEGRVDGALRYAYLRGKPSGESPSRLTHATKLDLEIVPDPLPREHWRYQAQKPAHFLLRWQGEPLANQVVILTTQNGSQLTLLSDEQGTVSFSLPDDFPQVEAGRSNNRPAEFVLTTTHQIDGKEYQTTFSAPYHVSPRHWQSNQLALWMVAGGFLGGLGLVRLIPRNGRKS